MKSYLYGLLLGILVVLALASRSSLAGADGGAPSFLKPGHKYEAAQVGVFTILQVGEGGWIRVRDRSGRPAWLNTNATQVIWEH